MCVPWCFRMMLQVYVGLEKNSTSFQIIRQYTLDEITHASGIYHVVDQKETSYTHRCFAAACKCATSG